MKSFLSKLCVSVAVLSLFSGCLATQTSGPTVPGKVISALVGSNVLMDDPTVLMQYATTDCNVAAAQEYRLSVLLCEGQLSSVIPGFLVPANLQATVAAACNVMGYTNASNQLMPNIVPVTVGPASACMTPAAATSAPLGEKLILN